MQNAIVAVLTFFDKMKLATRLAVSSSSLYVHDIVSAPLDSMRVANIAAVQSGCSFANFSSESVTGWNLASRTLSGQGGADVDSIVTGRCLVRTWFRGALGLTAMALTTASSC